MNATISAIMAGMEVLMKDKMLIGKKLIGKKKNKMNGDTSAIEVLPLKDKTMIIVKSNMGSHTSNVFTGGTRSEAVSTSGTRGERLMAAVISSETSVV